jgi:hypothetical protein
MAYNPMRIRRSNNGNMVDKYGRVMSYDAALRDAARKKKRVWISYHCLTPDRPRKD